MTLLLAIDWYARRAVAWPLALAGLLFTYVSEGLINAAAWVADVDTKDDDESL